MSVESKWANGAAEKAAAYLERHTEDYGSGYVEVPGWALAEAVTMIRDFSEENAKLREVNEAQGKRLGELYEENFALAAWQCVFHDGKTGIVCDEHGNQYCNKAKEVEHLASIVRRAQQIARSGE